MLVLSRKPGEKIYIGSGIVLTVLDVSGKFVRLGVDAPSSVTILRGEVKEQIERENRLAAEKSKHMEPLRKLASLLGVQKKR